MRTTVDVPDELMRKAKATAAIRGIKLKDLLIAFIERGLAGQFVAEQPGHSEPIPVQIPPAGRTIQVMTNAQLIELLDTEDDCTRGRLS